jgi:hypothetical protein
MKHYRWLVCLALLSLPMSTQAIPVAGAKKSIKKAPASLVVQGTVRAATRPPRPGSVAYKDAVIAVRVSGLKALQGRLRAKEIVVYTWGMRHNKRTRAATLRAGQTVKLQLTPWDKVEGRYGRYNRFELSGEDVYTLDTYWGEVR